MRALIAIDYYNAPSVAKFFVVLLIIAIFIRWAILGERPVGRQVPGVILVVYGLIGFFSLMYATNTQSVINTLNNYVKDALITMRDRKLSYPSVFLARTRNHLLMV